MLKVQIVFRKTSRGLLEVRLCSIMVENQIEWTHTQEPIHLEPLDLLLEIGRIEDECQVKS